MKPELIILHSQGKRTRQLKLHGEELVTIGSAKQARVRLGGKQISGCHAALERRGQEWYFCDLAGMGNTKVADQSIVEVQVKDGLEVEVGGHKLSLFVPTQKSELFTGALGVQGAGRDLHQIVIRKNGKVVESHILKAAENFEWNYGGEKRRFAAPSSKEWVTQDVGNCTVQQRLTSQQEIEAAPGFEFDRELRKPLLLALLFGALLMTLTTAIKYWTPTEATAQLDQKSLDIIFSAKAIQHKREEAKKVTASRKANPQGGHADAKASASTQPDVSQAPQASNKASAALTKIRSSGLSDLIGKIAKRANKQGVMIAAVGVSPDDTNSGRAFYSLGKSTTGGGAAAQAGETYRLGGVATAGLGGGQKGYKAGTALAGGSVGQGDVAVMDEETVIEGGLDREVIAEVIKRNLGQIRYCYERQLSANRDLYGKISVKFDIVASGEVAQPRIDSTNIKSAMMEGCILRRIAGWKFPLPKGGTTVKVSYPFLFKALD